MKKIFIFMVIGLMGCVGADDIPEGHPPGIDEPWQSGPGHGGKGGDGGSLPGLPGGKGGYGGHPSQPWRSGPGRGGRGGDGGSLPGLPGGKGGYGGNSHYSSTPRQPAQSWQREYEYNLYWYCLGLAKASTKRRWRDYMYSNDHMQNNYSPLYCERFSDSPRKLLTAARKRQSRYGRDGASYYGGIGGQGGRAGSGPGGGRGGNGGAGIAGGRGGHGGKGGNAY